MDYHLFHPAAGIYPMEQTSSGRPASQVCRNISVFFLQPD